MDITANNLLKVLESEGQKIEISGSSDSFFSVFVELKKNSMYRPALTTAHSGPPLFFSTAEKAVIYLREKCGYAGPVTVSDRSLKSEG